MIRLKPKDLWHRNGRVKPRRGGHVEPYDVTCWNCLGEFDAQAAVWCSDDPKNPTKLCPFCFRCFCAASDTYKQEFWAHAPARLKEELDTLARSRDRLGDILIRMKKITTEPAPRRAGGAEGDRAQKLGEVLVEQRAGHARRRGRRAQDAGHEPAHGHPGHRLRGQRRCGSRASRTRSSSTCSRWPRARARPTSASSPRRTRSTSATGSTTSSSASTPSPRIPGRGHAQAPRLLRARRRADADRPLTSRAAGHAGRRRVRAHRADPAHALRHQRHHQARQPRDLPQGPAQPGHGAGGPRPPAGPDAGLLRPRHRERARLQRRAHHDLFADELPRARRPRRPLAGVAAPMADRRARARSRSRTHGRDAGDAARHGGGASRRRSSCSRCRTRPPPASPCQLATSVLVIGPGHGPAREPGPGRPPPARPAPLAAGGLALRRDLQRLVRLICRVCREPRRPAARADARPARDRPAAGGGPALLPRQAAARPATRSATAGGARSSR